MKMKILIVAILASLGSTAQGQTVSELQQALAQAQKAAADAQKAAQQAQDALAQILAASKAQTAAATVPVRAAALTTDQNGVPLTSTNNSVTLYSSSDTSLRMYGLLEATISDVNHQTASGGTAAGFQTAWFSGNRLGFDAEHALAVGDDLGLANLKIIAKLESEFELPTGNMDTANVFFNRDAWLGVYSDQLGKITLGRQNTLTRDFTQTWGDPYGTADVSLKEGGYSNVNNFKQFIFYSAGATGTRLNSAVEWKKKLNEHWVAGLGYGFGSGGSGGSGDVGNGGGTPGDFTKGTTQEASIAYNGAQLGEARLSANLSFDRANVADLIHQSTLIGGNVTLGAFRFNTGLAHYTAQQGVNNSMGTRTDNSWTTSMSYQVTPKVEFDLGYQRMKGDHAGFGGGGTTLNPFGNTSGVTAVADGSKRTVYSSIIYHLDRQTDLYLAADSFSVSGGWVVGDAQGNGNHFGAGNPNSSEMEAAMGIRFKF